MTFALSGKSTSMDAIASMLVSPAAIQHVVVSKLLYCCGSFFGLHGVSLLSKLWKLVFLHLRKIIVLHIIDGVLLR